MGEVELAGPCRSCGEQTFASANFCSNCGAKSAVDNCEGRIQAVKEFASESLKQAEVAGRDLLKNKTAQKVAGGAVLGAGAATVIPFLTIGVGATLGAAYVAYKHLTKD